MNADDLIGEQRRVATEMRERRLEAQLSDARASARALAAELERAYAALGVTSALEGAERLSPITGERAFGRRKATAVLLCSDWHVEEDVSPAKVAGLNAYNPAEASRRVGALAEAVCWHITHQRHGYDIDNAVVWLGGDLISGYIHDELVEGNHMSPVEAVLFAQELAETVLDAVLSLPGIARLRVPCSYGNHGRTTTKPRIGTGAANSYEWLMYRSLAKRYADNPRVEFEVAAGEHIYLSAYDRTIRFHHGDAVKYQGGVGGITVPVTKAIRGWDTARRADLTCIGHFHSYQHHRSYVANGSLIGYGPYSQRIKAEYEAPAQAFFLLDSERGPCQASAVWV